YDLTAVRTVLDARDVFHEAERKDRPVPPTPSADDAQTSSEQPNGLGGVPEGRRNATAAAIIGGILGRLPEYLWETAGWGGLKEWNTRNPAPLPEAELRCVFVSIARRERTRREHEGRGSADAAQTGVPAQVDVPIEDGKAGN